MGADGHTASIFPGNEPEDTDRLVAAPWVEKLQSRRITLTLGVLGAARCVLFLVTGEDKARALREVFEDPASRLPAARVRPAGGDLFWYVDRAAAANLQRH
jgi:6-phosphogluconolactonase